MREQPIPKFPKTPHLAGAVSVGADDTVSATDFQTLVSNASQLFGGICLEEKLDGANVRILWDGVGEPIVGNRDKILSKGYLKDTTAKRQFRPLWGWVYENREKFAGLRQKCGPHVLYGEWLYAKHTIGYDRLPDLFVGFDLLNQSTGAFVDPWVCRSILMDCGFAVPPLKSGIEDAPSAWGPELAEGTYVKIGDGFGTVGRFKVVRSTFSPREDFNETELIRNVVAK